MDNLQAQLTAAFLISLLHGLIPSHWLPLVAHAKNQKWDWVKLLRQTVVIATIHTLGTIVIGYFVYHTAHLSHIGSLTLTHPTNSDNVALDTLDELRLNLPFEKFSAMIMFILGLIFLYRHYTHKHFHLDHKKFGRNMTVGIALAMFLSPCMEIIGFYFTLAPLGWDAFFKLSIIYLITTQISITAGVMLFNKGLSKINAHKWEHNAGIFSSVLLMISAVFMWFF
jgi:nickel/cobalt transporter (NicO) family protein